MRTAFCLVLVVAFFALVTGCGQDNAPPVDEGDKKPEVEKTSMVIEKEVQLAMATDKEIKLAMAVAAKEEAVVEVKKDAGKKPVEMVASKKKSQGFVFRINCGAEEDYTDPAKNVWKADKEFAKGGWGYEGGDIVVRDYVDKIAKTDMHKVYLAEHYGIEAYRITCPNGTYSVVLHFAETYLDEEGLRIFDVAIEEKKVLTAFDPYKAAGKDLTAVSKTFEVKVTDGEVTITFTEREEMPMINGIEVIQKK